MPKGDPGQAKGVIEHIKGKDGTQAEQKDYFETLAADGIVDGGELFVSGHFSGDPGPSDVSTDQKGGAGTQG